jgi:hypothetical protein
MLPNSTLEQARTIAERMRAGVSATPLTFRPRPRTTSIGIAQWLPGDTVASLVQRADQALYEAKRAGADQVAGSLPQPKRPAVPGLAQMLGEHHDAILVEMQTRLIGEDSMVAMAEQRGLSERELLSQVFGFWLQAIRTDAELGSTAGLAQNLDWLVRLRAGHGLQFEDSMVLRMFNELSTAVQERIDSQDIRAQYAAYQADVTDLISCTFPQPGPDRR